jgi:hypothetical protein
MFEVYTVWQYWAILGVMGLCQYALLALPVRVASRRPETAGAIWPTVLAGAFMMALLAVGAGASLSELGDNGIPPSVGRIILGLALTSWLGWSIQFWRTARRTPGAAAIKRQTRTLLAGSVLELLIAVPSHIIVRHRHVCCAGLLTFFGLTCGVSVMLFAFGPAVFFLFAERWKRLHPAAAAAPAQKT